MLTGEVKKELIQVLTDIAQEHQVKRAAVTPDVIQQFMAVRPLIF